jgi:HSP20 family protein
MALVGVAETAETGSLGEGRRDTVANRWHRSVPQRERCPMTLIRRPRPLADLVSFQDAMERLFDDRWFKPMWISDGERRTRPAMDLYTTPEAVVARVALPGVKPEDVDVTIVDDLVTVSGAFTEETENSEAGYVQKELTQGTFSRSFSLPTAIQADAATAEFKDGLLTLTLPKSEDVKPTHVKVQVV